MHSGGWQMIGMAALMWLMLSDTVDRLIPVPIPVLDPAVLRAGVPGLVETDGRPDLQATLARLRATAMGDMQSRLGALLLAAEERAPGEAWPDLLLVRKSPPLPPPVVDAQLLGYDRAAVLQQVLDGLKQLDEPTTEPGRRAAAALREQPPDPTFAATLILDWYAAAILAVSHGDPLPEVPPGSPRLNAARARPLAERMVEPLTIAERSKVTAELLVNPLLARRRALFETLRRRSATPTADAPAVPTVPGPTASGTLP